MQQFGQVLFIPGILFAFAAGIGFEHPWSPVGLAVFGVFTEALSSLWKIHH